MAGVAAAFLADNPQATPAEVKAAIVQVRVRADRAHGTCSWRTLDEHPLYCGFCLHATAVRRGICSTAPPA